MGVEAWLLFYHQYRAIISDLLMLWRMYHFGYFNEMRFLDESVIF